MDIHQDLKKNGSFPKGERELCYQEYYLDNKWHQGQREVRQRASLMGLNVKQDELVVEIGCQIGGFLQYAYLNGAKCIGIDIDEDYIRLATDLATRNDQDIKYLCSDITQELLQNLLKFEIDHLLLLSMGKHIGEEKLFGIIDILNPKNVYIETNAVKINKQFPYLKSVSMRGGKVVGKTVDRNNRVLYRISF